MNSKKLLKYYHDKRVKDLRKYIDAKVEAINMATKLAHKNKANSGQVAVAIIIGLSGLVIGIINIFILLKK